MFSIPTLVVVLLVVSAPLASAQESGDPEPTSVVVTGDEVTVTVTVTPSPDRSGDEPPPTYSAVIGVGVVVRLDDVVDFKPSETHLLVHNPGRVRPSLSPGLMARFGQSRFSFLLTPNFEAKTTAVFDGVMLGAAFDVGSFHVGGGVVLRLGEELSDTFRDRVRHALRDHPDELAVFARACRWGYDCSEDPDVDQTLDGFPLVVAGERIFPGNPLRPSINRGLFFGAFVPFKFRDLFR